MMKKTKKTKKTVHGINSSLISSFPNQLRLPRGHEQA